MLLSKGQYRQWIKKVASVKDWKVLRVYKGQGWGKR